MPRFPADHSRVCSPSGESRQDRHQRGSCGRVCLSASRSDVRSSEVFEEFQPAFRELTAAYGRLGAGVVSGPVAATLGVDQLGGLLVQAVEVVIRIRSRGEEITRGQVQAIAATCLRMCGVPEERLARAAASVEKRLA